MCDDVPLWRGGSLGAEGEESGFSSQNYPDCPRFLSEFDWPILPDPEDATVLETSELLPSSRVDLRVCQERLDAIEKAHSSHCERRDDVGPAGPLKLLRMSHAGAWEKIYGKLHAAEKVEYCVEYGLEAIRLGSSLLGSVSSTSLRPLRYPTEIACHLDESGKDSRLDVPEEPIDNRLTPYVSLVPRFVMYLEKNRLQFLPGALYSIRNLSVLSVRDNQLISLLPSISHLEYLVELNLSNNCLQWLPYELKKLASIPEQLRIAGNPLVLANVDHPGCQPLDHVVEVGAINASFQDGMWLRRITAVTFLDMFGSARGPAARMSMFHASIRSSPPMMDPRWLKAYIPGDEPLPVLEHRTQAPSLMESVLRAASKQPALYNLVADSPEDLPRTLGMLLRHTLRVREAEGQKCSVCAKKYFVPRTEWIEWWSVERGEDRKAWIPFIRFGCSPSCFFDHEARKASMG